MVTVERPRGRTGRWAAAAGIAAVSVGIVVGGVLLTAGPDLEESMDRRVVAVLERAPAESASHGAHAGHGGPANAGRRTDIDGHELVCVAKAFGHDPVGATEIDDVTVIYAHRMCAAVGPGLVWPDSVRETGPVVVRLGIPDALVLPEDALPGAVDAQYADRVRAVVPPRLHELALVPDPGVAEDLRDLVED